MRLVASIGGAQCEPGSSHAIQGNTAILVETEGVPASWLERELRVRVLVDGSVTSTELLRPPRSVPCTLPNPKFWRPSKVRLELIEGEECDSPLAVMGFEIVTENIPVLAQVAALLLLVAGVYLSLAFPNWVSDAQVPLQVGVGGITLGATLIPRTRDWVLRRLRRPLYAMGSIALAVAFAAIANSYGAVVVNRSGGKLQCSSADKPALASGQWSSSCSVDAPKPDGPYCEVGSSEKQCFAFGEPPDLPFLARYGLLRSKVYGCLINAEPGEMLKAWQESGLCRPPRLQWESDDVSHALIFASKDQDALATRIVASCDDTKSRGCERPVEGTDFLLRQFKPLRADTKMPMELFLASDGPLREIYASNVKAESWIPIPFPLGAVEARATVLLGGREIGHALLRPTAPPESEPGKGNEGQNTKCWLLPTDVFRFGWWSLAVSGQNTECWLLPTDEHLERLVVRGAFGTARFDAVDASAVSSIPVCWSRGKEVDAVELYLHRSWSPRAGWSIQLPADWFFLADPSDQPAAERHRPSVRIYSSADGFLGEVKASDSDKTQSPEGASCRVVLRRIENWESVPVNSLGHLTSARLGEWASALPRSEWFWSASLITASDKSAKQGNSGNNDTGSMSWTSGKSADVTVRCSDEAKNACRAFAKPVHCWFKVSGTRVAQKDCREMKPGIMESHKKTLKARFAPPNCNTIHVCE